MEFVREIGYFFRYKFQLCGKEHCDVCDKIVAVLQGEVTAKELSSWRRYKRLPTDFAKSDNNMAYKKFCSNSMGLDAGQCISHLTGKLIDCVVICCIDLSCFNSDCEKERNPQKILRQSGKLRHFLWMGVQVGQLSA